MARAHVNTVCKPNYGIYRIPVPSGAISAATLIQVGRTITPGNVNRAFPRRKTNMFTSNCECGNVLFFDSFKCVGCGVDVGVCESCHQITPIRTNERRAARCERCHSRVTPCANREPNQICNVWSVHSDPAGLCRSCRLTRVIPDLTVTGNIDRWRALEAAKRRVLFDLTTAGLPFDNTPETAAQPLSFEFKADGDGPVATGHADGRITINVREADPVEREKTRVEFGEHQRTLVGHFRHELGHYYWDLLVKPFQLDQFHRLFGNECDPPYDVAKQQYYEQGPQSDWQREFISAYASMHPWEDFAESFAALLDMMAVLRTARHFQMFSVDDSDGNDFESILETYQRVGIAVNELNRDMGLLDLVPEVHNEPIAAGDFPRFE